jgi:hypothetical protein
VVVLGVPLSAVGRSVGGSGRGCRVDDAGLKICTIRHRKGAPPRRGLMVITVIFSSRLSLSS